MAVVVLAARGAQRLDRFRQRELLADEAGDEAPAAHLTARLQSAIDAEQRPPRRHQSLAGEKLAHDDAVAAQ